MVMSLALDDSITIRRPPDQVWRVLTDWPNATRWMKSVEGIEGDSVPRAGAEVFIISRGKRRAATLADVQPGESLCIEAGAAGIKGRYRFALEAVGDDATTVRLRASCSGTGLRRPLAAMIRSAIKRVDGHLLARLKGAVESAGRPAAVNDNG